ncbi:MAG: SAM-dependent methyltransferase [Ktedonobacteraceae bacterium]
MPTILQQLISERIQREGSISFADYMRMALYEPNHGYYMTGAAKMGWEGDYYTSTDVSSLFAHCVGRQLVQMWELLEHPDPFVVLEQGSGRGNLAQQINSWARQAHADMYTALEYQTEDIRAGSDATQKSDAIPVSVLLSNELVDAFPVHIVEKRDRHLYEVFVAMHHGRMHEVLDEPSSAEVVTYLDSYKIPWSTYDDGWRAEINLDALRWMQHAAHMLSGPANRKHHGFLLAIDYGDKARALYTRERQRGTLACYFQHQLTERPLVRPGEQDITAHVNFSALIDEGRRQGLRLHAFMTQKAWLEEMGLTEEVEQLRKTDFAAMDMERATDKGQTALFQWYMLRQRIAALTDPMGMGNFKVLVMKC